MNSDPVLSWRLFKIHEFRPGDVINILVEPPHGFYTAIGLKE